MISSIGGFTPFEYGETISAQDINSVFTSFASDIMPRLGVNMSMTTEYVNIGAKEFRWSEIGISQLNSNDMIKGTRNLIFDYTLPDSVSSLQITGLRGNRDVLYELYVTGKSLYGMSLGFNDESEKYYGKIPPKYLLGRKMNSENTTWPSSSMHFFFGEDGGVPDIFVSNDLILNNVSGVFPFFYFASLTQQSMHFYIYADKSYYSPTIFFHSSNHDSLVDIFGGGIYKMDSYESGGAYEINSIELGKALSVYGEINTLYSGMNIKLYAYRSFI